jgi:hypothetical protein
VIDVPPLREIVPSPLNEIKFAGVAFANPQVLYIALAVESYPKLI